MDVQVVMDGMPVVKAELNLPLLVRLLATAAAAANAVHKSTPATKDQLVDVLKSVDPRSAQFLREIAASKDGGVSWLRMRKIYGITKKEDWAAYSGSFGKGITRAFRFATGSKAGKLVWWDDDQWYDAEWDDEARCRVFVDGPALAALRDAV